MKHLRIICLTLVFAVLLGCLAGCGGKDKHEEDLLLYLPLDEGKGARAADKSGHLAEADIDYPFTHAVFMEPQDPQWRKTGVAGGCLLLDGSTFVTYGRNDITVEGKKLTVSCWIAPRTFEWDDPNAQANDTAKLTGIVSQTDMGGKKGFILGYQRYGALSFQVGTGSDWLTVWTNGDNLQKYQWNYVAAVFDADAEEMALYLNGEKVASRSVPKDASIAGAKRNLVVGRSSEGERMTAGFVNAMSGYLDEVKLYGAALSGEEISKAYKSVKVPEIPFEEIWLQNILTTDYTRPQFHAAPYQFWMNEPHAPFYYNGMYHLFFQQNMSGSYWRNIQWGHWVSSDMVNWKPVKEAIVPTEGSVVPDGVWSGGAAMDVNGVPLLFYTAGNDGFRNESGLISNQNIAIAYPADLSDPELIEWKLCDELAIAQKSGEGRTGEFRDPTITKIGDTWYMLVCSGSTVNQGGAALVYTTKTLELKDDGTVDMDWQFRGSIYDMPNPAATFGTSWELPILLPLKNEAGTVEKYFFSISPAPAGTADNKVYYFLGSFDTETCKFTPDPGFETPHILDYGANVFTGPSAIVDPVSGDTVLFSIMQDQRSAADQGASGWAHTAGIGRKIWLNDDGSDVKITPIDALDALEGEVLLDEKGLTIDEANQKLANVSGDMLHIELTVDVSGAARFGINLKKGGQWDSTTYTYDVEAATIRGETQNKGDDAKTGFVSGALPIENGKLTINIYIDRSLVEAFFNEDKALSIRAYPDEKTSQGIDLFADGTVTIESLRVATMGSIFD